MSNGRIDSNICRGLPHDLERQCNLDGANLAERKKAEAGEVGRHAAVIVLEEVSKHGAQDGATEIAKGIAPEVTERVAKLTRPLTPLVLAIAGTKAIKEFVAILPEQGKLRADAIGRENHNLGMAFVAEEAKPGLFPPGWVSHQREQLMGPTAKLGDSRHTGHVVNKVIDTMEEGLASKDAAMTAYRDYWVANAGAGVREAHARDVHDDPSLAAARKDPSFRESYDHDPAFREGVRAAVWQASAHPADFAAARRQLTALSDQLANANVGRSA